MRLCVIVINYRTAGLTVECLESLVGEVAEHQDRCVIVVDNASGDGSDEAIERAIDERGWGEWVRLIRSPRNGGFSAGNNLGFSAVSAEAYLLLNSDARLRPGAAGALLASLDARPDAGLVGPRLEDPDGTPQVSCFRDRSPVSELLAAAATGPLSRVLGRFVVALGVPDAVTEVPWVSFACVLVRGAVLDRIGPMDEGYFMYFEDIDYARHARGIGFTIRCEPAARVVHLRGGTSSVKAAMQQRRRVPRYYYESRSRYFARYYGGRPGLWTTNLLWLSGRAVAAARERVGGKRPHARELEARDNWTNWLRPWRAPRLPGGGEL